MPDEKSMEEKEREIKIKLFGKTVKLPATGGHIVDVIQVTAPITDDSEAVIRLFCYGCGSYMPLNQSGLEALAARANVSYLPESLTGCYFQAERCLACGDGFGNVTFHT